MRIIDFQDGFTSSEQPEQGNVRSNQLKVFASDEAFVTDKGSAATQGDTYTNSTTDTFRLYNDGAWVNITIEDSSGNVNVPGNLVVEGDLEVQGTSTTINTVDLDIEDNEITLNKGGDDSSAEEAGIEVERDATNGSLKFDSGLPTYWKVGLSGAESAIVDVATIQSVANKSFDNTNSIVIKDTSLVVEADGDPTKQLVTDLSGMTTDKSATLAFDNADDATHTFPSATGRLVSRDSSDQLTNKDIDGGTASDTSRITLPKAATATLSGLTRKQGTVVYDTDLNKAFIDNGSALTAIGSGTGSGELNVISNPSAADAITGWVASGAGLTVARSTTSTDLPLEGIISSAIKITPVSGTSDYVYYRWTMPAALKNKKLKIQWDQRPLSGYASGDLKVEVHTNTLSNYSGTDATLPLSTDSSGVSSIPNQTGRFTTTFDSDSSDYYGIRIYRTAGTTALNLANVVIGPGIQPQGAIVGPWVSFTPTGLWTTNTSYSGFYRRVGTNLELRVVVSLTNAPDNSIFTLNLPNTLTLDTSSVTTPSNDYSIYGQAFLFDNSAAANNISASVVYNSATSLRLRPVNDADVTVAQVVPFTWNTSDRIEIVATVPIAEWAGSGTVNLAQNDVEYASTSGTWDAASTTTVYGPSGSAMGGTLAAGRTKTITWQTPCQSTDRIQLWVSKDRIQWVPMVGAELSTGVVTNMTSDASASTSSGVRLTPGATTSQTIVEFRQYLSIATDGSPVAEWPSDAYWVATKSKAGQAVGFGLASGGSSGLINYYNETSVNVASSGDFSTGTLNIKRVGKVVTITASSSVTHNSAHSPNSASGLIPSWARPADTTYNVYYFGATTVQRCSVAADGLFQCHYRDWAGSTSAQTTTTVPPTITYTVA